jgi:tetratricopeptide (TPR) repeat protein
MAKQFQYHDFKENDAWLVFRVDTQVKNESVDVYLLMDLPKGIILVHEISIGEGLSPSQAEEFLKKGKSKKGNFPKRLILAKGDPAESVLLQAANAFGMALDTVPASQLEGLTAPLKKDFGKHFFSPSSIPYAGLQDDTSAEDRESAKKMIPDSYDPCWCASGKKFKFCCKPIFREIIGAMKAAEEGRTDEALEWIAGAKKIAGETAEVLCREAIVYSYFDQKKSDEVLARALQVNPNHPRALYILGIHLKEKGDLKGAATAYETAIAHYPSTDRFHLNEAYNNLGSVRYDMRDYARAKSAWEQALILLPSDRMVRQNLIEFIYENPIVPLPVREVRRLSKVLCKPAEFILDHILRNAIFED